MRFLTTCLSTQAARAAGTPWGGGSAAVLQRHRVLPTLAKLVATALAKLSSEHVADPPFSNSTPLRRHAAPPSEYVVTARSSMHECLQKHLFRVDPLIPIRIRTSTAVPHSALCRVPRCNTARTSRPPGGSARCIWLTRRMAGPPPAELPSLAVSRSPRPRAHTRDARAQVDCSDVPPCGCQGGGGGGGIVRSLRSGPILGRGRCDAGAVARARAGAGPPPPSVVG